MYKKKYKIQNKSWIRFCFFKKDLNHPTASAKNPIYFQLLEVFSKEFHGQLCERLFEDQCLSFLFTFLLEILLIVDWINAPNKMFRQNVYF